jgi:hypothetical protein
MNEKSASGRLSSVENQHGANEPAEPVCPPHLVDRILAHVPVCVIATAIQSPLKCARRLDV